MVRRFAGALVAAVLFLASQTAWPGQSGLDLAYDIILSGVTKMGTITMRVWPDQENGLLVVDGEQHIDIQGRTVDIVWTEKWRGNRLVAFDGRSRINRKSHRGVYEITLREDGDTSLLTVNGNSVRVAADIAPRSWWRKENVVGRTHFFDIDDGSVSEEVPQLEGERQIKFDGKKRKTELWKMHGEKKRDFWFLAANGVLVKYQRPRGALWYTYELTSIR